jgi:hypothetical protein
MKSKPLRAIGAAFLFSRNDAKSLNHGLSAIAPATAKWTRRKAAWRKALYAVQSDSK